MRNGKAVRWMFVALALGLSTPALAVDGVLEINQTCAVNTGCFSGDSAGLPVTITAAGSYRLTSNLTVPDENTGGITVSANHVGIDLNNLAIIGPVTCSGTPLACSHASGTGSGIYTEFDGISVKNGSITGMGGYGVKLGPQAEVTSLRVSNNRFTGVRVSDEGFFPIHGGTVSGNTAYKNGEGGIFAGPSSTVSGNRAYDNGRNGITASAASTVSGNTAYNNGDMGIFAGLSSTVSGSTAYNNGDDGIYAMDGSTVSGNAAFHNGGDGIATGYGSMIFNNTARSNTGFGIRMGSTTTYRGNVLTENGGGGVLSGVNRGSNYCAGTGVVSAYCP